ncbi:MAG: DNA repair protein RadA [Thermoanaerobaculia bacterium]
MSKRAVVYSCSECGAQSSKWLGRCPECNAWNSFAEENVAPKEARNTRSFSSGGAPVAIDQVDFDDVPRISTRLPHFDRVLGGGVVPGSVVLVGGEPGIGKSTLLLQMAERLSGPGPVLYVSGEESPRQIALRAKRLGITTPRISLFPETSAERIIEATEKLQPVALIVDSIQTIHTSANQSAPGSVGQVRDCAGILMTLAKRLSVPVFMIGHITKEGTIAGPKTLEHIVDTVLYFEGDRFQNARIIRAYKNRFGPVNELAMYEMHDDGLEEIPNPSAALLAQRSSAPGSAVVVTVEGTRPLMIEVQALVSPSRLATPRRMAIGVDVNRLTLLLAVLEKRGNSNFQNSDVYANVTGGIELDEPAIDLGIIAALLSSENNRAVPHDLAVFGEVGLLGEVRSISQSDARAREAAALGFRKVILPATNQQEVRADVDVVGVRRIEDFAQRLFE